MEETIEITEDLVKPYWLDSNRKVHENYLKALDAYHHMAFHADGYFIRPSQTDPQKQYKNDDPYLKNYYFERLIDQRRPKESPVINAFRRDRYFPRTKMVVSKIINSLKKIVKSREWNIDYTKANVPANIPKDETLEEYCENNYPKYDSLEHWAYRIGIRQMLIDPNALAVVMPLDFNISQGEYYRPFLHVIPCKDVLDIVEDKWCIFVSPYKSTYISKGKEVKGKQMIVVTTEAFYQVNQIDDKGNFEILEVYRHEIGDLPAWILGGQERSTTAVSPYAESFISDILPALDQAAIDFSDLEAEKSQHLHSTVWVVQTQQCDACQGTGRVKGKGKNTKCPQCEGRGAAALEPYRELIINLNNILDPKGQAPTPPMGYVEKSTDMAKIQVDMIKQEKYEALAAINMEFLMDEPLNQSGTAKEVDRDELNNFVYGIAYHLVVNILDPAYYFINEMRYRKIVPGADARKKMLPKIAIPETFDILTRSAKEDNLAKISKSDISPDIKEIYEDQFVQEVFQDDPETRDKLKMAHVHNPLPGRSDQDIATALRAGIVTRVDAILATYLKLFLGQILVDDSSFLKKTWDEQHKILVDMAKKKLEEDSAESQINAIAAQGQGAPQPGPGNPDPTKKQEVKQTGNPSKTGAPPTPANPV